MKRLIVIISILAAAGLTTELWSCTTFIMSGKYTPDGRPILYKNRDTGTLDNALVIFTDGRYRYIGLVDSRDSWKREVWAGFNSAGFAIMNSAAYNNNTGDTTKFSDQEGVLMKMALATCATLKDFEKMLTDIPKPLGVDTNFGVIDARGGAAYYETGNFGFKKIDANDPSLAPYGLIIRTNHSFTGTVGEGGGYIRYAAASEVLNMALAQNRLDPHYLLNSLSRNLTHALTKVNLRAEMPADAGSTLFRNFDDFIPRTITAATVMVVGVAAGEDPSHAMMWTLLGFPLTTVALPVWITPGNDLPVVVSMKDDFHSPLCDAAMALKIQLFPIKRGSGGKYMNLALLLNHENTGIMQKLEPVENEIFRRTADLMANMPEKNRERSTLILEHYRWLDTFITESYKELFGADVR
jgi:hypothetical protein